MLSSSDKIMAQVQNYSASEEEVGFMDGLGETCDRLYNILAHGREPLDERRASYGQALDYLRTYADVRDEDLEVDLKDFSYDGPESEEVAKFETLGDLLDFIEGRDWNDIGWTGEARFKNDITISTYRQLTTGPKEFEVNMERKRCLNSEETVEELNFTFTSEEPSSSE